MYTFIVYYLVFALSNVFFMFIVITHFYYDIKKMLALSQKSQHFLKDQRFVFQFLISELKKQEQSIIMKQEDYFVAQLITDSEILNIINQEIDNNQQYRVNFNLQYGELTCDQEHCAYLGTFLGHDFSLTNDTYVELIKQMKEKIQYLGETSQFAIPEEEQGDITPTKEEEKLAINLIDDALIVEDINKVDNDTICSSLKKLWPILVCICFCGASLGVCLVNAPLHLQQELGATGMMVTLYQASFSFAQLFGSPICHWLSEKIGYKPVYTGVYACYTITMGLMSLDTIEKMKTREAALGFIYAMRIIQGFTGISQPLGFSMLSASISPRLRSYAAAMNNISYYIGALLGTVINAFIAPAAGWYSETNNTITYVNSMYICCVLCGLAFIFSLFVKECNPETLLKRECKKNGTTYHPTKQAKCTWKEAFGTIFTNKNLVLSFVGLVLGLGDSISNANIATMMIGSKMHFYNTVSAQKFASIMAMVGVLFCALFAFTLYQPCLKWLGLMPVVAISCWLAAICSMIRSSPPPLQQIPIALSAILNQFGQILIDSPFISIVSTYTNSYNKARVMGVYQLSNSLSRSILVFLAGVMYDWHVRDAQYCYTYFAMAAATVAAFIKQPVNVKFV